MNTHDTISDEELNAFVDNELDTVEWMRIVQEMQKDEALSARVCGVRQLRDTVCLAYRTPPPRPPSRARIRHSALPLFSAAAGVVLLLAGGILGWVLATRSVGLESVAAPQQLAAVEQDEEQRKRVIVHVSSADPTRLDAALDQAEAILGQYHARGEEAQLEVVANYEGIALLRADGSPYAERIRKLTRDYRNIAFLACARAIERLQLKGIQVNLIPEAKTIPSALQEIVTRLQDGWAYIRA